MEAKTDVIVVGAGSPAWWPRPRLPTRASGWSWSIRRPNRIWAGRRSGRWAACSWSIRPSSAAFGIKDSYELALGDWMGTAGFDRPEDHWPRKWAEAYVAFAAGEMRPWLHAAGHALVPGRGLGRARRLRRIWHGNSVPRFHVTWGTGPGVLEPFVRRAREAEKRRPASLPISPPRRRPDRYRTARSRASAAPSSSPTTLARGEELPQRNRRFRAAGAGGHRRLRRHRRRLRARAQELARRGWAPPPQFMVQGVPDYVDGRMLEITEAAGAALINRDRMWHYTEGLHNWNPIWTNHGIRILPGPSSLWLDATGKRLPPPLFPGFDTLGTLEYIMKTGYDYSWFVLNQKIIQKEFALSGSEQNPDLTNKDWRSVIARAAARTRRRRSRLSRTWRRFRRGRQSRRRSSKRMNEQTGAAPARLRHRRSRGRRRDRQLDNPSARTCRSPPSARRGTISATS